MVNPKPCKLTCAPCRSSPLPHGIRSPLLAGGETSGEEHRRDRATIECTTLFPGSNIHIEATDMDAEKKVEFVLATPPLQPGLWKIEEYSFLDLEYLKITDLKTGESVLGRVLEPEGELNHVGNWRDSRRFTAFG